MANCHQLFTQFNSVIRLSNENREMLKATRDNIREKISRNYQNHLISSHVLEFHSQGSYVMDTIITPEGDDYDLDDGVYFLGQLSRDKRPSCQQFHDLIIKLIGPVNDTFLSVEDKATCVRVNTKAGFHIDLPIYYAGDKNSPDLAHKVAGWILSNPIEFIAWFEEKAQSGFQKAFIFETKLFSQYEHWREEVRKQDVQLRRLVRYLKVWADLRKGDMPSGIIMTILAAENFSLNERDDIALSETLSNIYSKLEAKFECLRPTTPKNEDLFQEYSNTQKEYFLTALKTFKSSAEQAINIPNSKDACLKWQKHLGYRFPCHLAKDEIEGSNSYQRSAIIGSSAESAMDGF